MLGAALEPLKSITILRLGLPTGNGDSSVPPFYVTPSPDLNEAACCATSDGSLVFLSGSSVPVSIVAGFPPAEQTVSIALGRGRELFVGCVSPAQGGAVYSLHFGDFPDRAQKTLRLVCGHRGRALRDGEHGVGSLHTPSLMLYFPGNASTPPLLAISDKGSHALRIATVASSDEGGYGTLHTVCGYGVPGYCDGEGHHAALREVTGMLWTSTGDLLFCDGPNHAIRLARRRQRPSSEHSHSNTFAFDVVTLIGGSPKRLGFEDGLLSSALCNFPCGLCPGQIQNTVIFADRGSNALRELNTRTGCVRTLASTADYEAGAPLPQGLVEPSQVFALSLRASPDLTADPHAVALMCVSQTTRSISLIVTASLPLPTRRPVAGEFTVGTLYSLANAAVDLSATPARIVELSRPPRPPPAGSSKALSPSPTYAEIEVSRKQRGDREALRAEQRATVSSAHRRSVVAFSEASAAVVTTPTSARPKHSPPQSSVAVSASFSTGPKSSMRESSRAGEVGENRVPEEAPQVKHLRLIYDANATPAVESRGAGSSGTASSHPVSMRALRFWAFCIAAEIAGTPSRTIGDGHSSSDVLWSLYEKSYVRDGYKILARMPFDAFVQSIHFLHKRRQSQKGSGVQSEVDGVGAAVKTYVANHQAPEWRARQTLLDLLSTNERPIRRIFDAYANSVDRGAHVGRVPLLRLQSMLHTVHIFPSLITHQRLKDVFFLALSSSIFSSTESAPEANHDRKLRDAACRDGSLNLFQFVETIVRVAWSCFGIRDEDIVRRCLLPDDDAVPTALESFFRWMNVEMELMEAPTEVEERNREGNNGASAVFPARTPLFECRRNASLVGGSTHGSLEKDLRKLRQQQSALDVL